VADLDFLERSSPVQIVGGDELFAADVNSRQELEVNEGIRSQIINGALTVGTTALEVKVGASRLFERRGIKLFNNSSRLIYWGDSSVSISNGIPLEKKQFVIIKIGDVPLFVISDQGGLDARVAEFK